MTLGDLLFSFMLEKNTFLVEEKHSGAKAFQGLVDGTKREEHIRI